MKEYLHCIDVIIVQGTINSGDLLNWGGNVYQEYPRSSDLKLSSRQGVGLEELSRKCIGPITYVILGIKYGGQVAAG